MNMKHHSAHLCVGMVPQFFVFGQQVLPLGSVLAGKQLMVTQWSPSAPDIPPGKAVFARQCLSCATPVVDWRVLNGTYRMQALCL